MSTDSIKQSGFLKFSLANLLQLVLMVSLLLNWWGVHESTPAVQAEVLRQHAERISTNEAAIKTMSNDLTQVKSDVKVLVAVAEEQRKKQK